MIDVQLERSDNSFVPGENVCGSVQWSEMPDDSQSMEVRLIWYTTGKGDRDVDVIAVHTVEAIQSNGQSSFQFEAPDYPHSFSGKLISLVWAIEVIVFPSRHAEVKEITVSPSGSEIIFTKSTSD